MGDLQGSYPLPFPPPPTPGEMGAAGVTKKLEGQKLYLRERTPHSDLISCI